MDGNPKEDARNGPRNFVLHNWFLLAPFVVWEDSGNLDLPKAKIDQTLAQDDFKAEIEVSQLAHWQKSESQFVREYPGQLNFSILRIHGQWLPTTKAGLIAFMGKPRYIYEPNTLPNVFGEGWGFSSTVFQALLFALLFLLTEAGFISRKCFSIRKENFG